jgi:hypothetical protein
MEKLVEIIGVTHTPFLPKILSEAEPGSVAETVRDEYAWMREKLADAKPDLIVTVASDHLNQWFTENMPGVPRAGPRWPAWRATRRFVHVRGGPDGIGGRAGGSPEQSEATELR